MYRGTFTRNAAKDTDTVRYEDSSKLEGNEVPSQRLQSAGDLLLPGALCGRKQTKMASLVSRGAGWEPMPTTAWLNAT